MNALSRTQAAAAIVALWLVYWWSFLGGDAVPYVRDVLVYALPMKHFLVERLSAGEWPQWCPYLGAGTPYLADPANQALYPMNLLYLAAPDALRGLAWSMAAHGLLAALAAYALARALGIARGQRCGVPAALACLVRAGDTGLGRWVAAAGVALACGPRLRVRRLHIVDIGKRDLPVGRGVGTRRARLPGEGRRHGPRPVRVAAAGVALACLVLAGNVIDTAGAIAVAAVIGMAREPAAPMRRLGVLAIATGLAVLLAGAQVLPALELEALSVRAAGLAHDEAVRWSLPPARLLELVQPYVLGSDFADRFLRPALYSVQTRPLKSQDRVHQQTPQSP